MRKAILILILVSACSKKHNGTSLVGAWTFVHGYSPVTALAYYTRPDTAQPADYSMTLYGDGNYFSRWAGLPSDSGTYTYTGDTLYLESLVAKSTIKYHYQVNGDSLFLSDNIIFGTSTQVYARMPGSL